MEVCNCPKLYPMVDFGGADLGNLNGVVIPGIFEQVDLALTEDKKEIFYNWYFFDILLSPAVVTIDDSDATKFVVNDGIIINDNDTVLAVGQTPAIIESLTATENGTYNPSSGVDGFSPVVVNVSPTLQELNVYQNGDYLPASGYDGFSKVKAQVPIPTIESLSVTENGVYEHNFGGYNPVTVNVPNNLLTPIVCALGYAFVSGGTGPHGENGTFNANIALTTCLSVFTLEGGKKYAIFSEETPGNRFRPVVFYDLTLEEFYSVFNTPHEATSIVSYGYKIYYDDTEIEKRFYVTPSADCLLIIGTSSQSVVKQAYVVEIPNSI